jgi:predicted nucleotidyltransferase
VSNTEESLPRAGSNLRQAFETLITVLNERGIQYAIIGGIAVIQHTRIRSTDDVDALLTVPQIAMPGFFESLQAHGFDLDVVKSIHEFRDGGMTTIRFKDVLVDLLRPVLPVYNHVLEGAVNATIFGMPVRVSSAEGLIVMKLVGMRPQDEADIRELLAAYAGKIDLEHVRRELDSFIDRADPRRIKLESMIGS